MPTYKETLPGGVTHTIIEIQGDTGFNDNTDVFTVPPDNYFMMGDNRDNSTDSRVPPEQGGVGFVPFENLEGRAEIIFFSVGKGEPAWAFWNWPSTLRFEPAVPAGPLVMARRRKRRKVMRDLSALEERIGYAFADRALLERALTHVSTAAQARRQFPAA